MNQVGRAGKTADEMVGQKAPSEGLKRAKLQTYLMLHGILFLYSLGAVCSKIASSFPFLSLGYIAWYCGLLCVLVVYAFVWQQVLRRLPLITAFANKGITIIWGLLWGAVFFGETISLTMLLGAALVFIGILLVVSSNDN